MNKIKKIMVISIIFVLLPFFRLKVYAEDGQVIENGIYEIETNISNIKVLDISAASMESRANVQIWDRSNVYQQRFEIKYIGDGYYTIKSVKSGKMLDVADASTKLGTNVQQYTSNLSNAQKWKIEKDTQGKYNIISKCNGLYLTVASYITQNGTNIEVDKKSNLANQQFNFKKVEQVKGTKTLEEGLYIISTALDKTKVLDISAGSELSRANVQIWKDSNVAQQKFYLKYDGKGYYTITNLRSGKLLDVANGDIGKGTNVQQYTSNSTDAQKWVIKQTEDGYYNIISKSSGIYLDVAGGKTANGTNVQINILTGENKQKFLFTKIDDNIGIIETGVYEITTALASNMLLDVSGGDSRDGTNIQIWADANEKQQKFELAYAGNGSYKLICKRTSKAVTVATDGTEYSANVYQSTYKEKDEQLWILKDLGDGYYNIISKYNGKYLDVENSKTSNGTNIRVYNSNNSNSQKFKLEQKQYGIDVSHWQNTIDFKALYESDTIDFVIIRAGYGTTLKDRQFENNYSGAKKYNLPVGVYLYARAQSVEEVKNEANYLVNMLKGKSFELPIFYDVEEHENLNKNTITNMCLEFYNIIKKAGYKPGIYASKYYLMSKIDTNKMPTDCYIWVASYGKNDGTIPNDTYKYYERYSIWQYTSTGNVDGIVGDVDCNVRN